jgi:gliding motility-associated-like protein
LKAILSIIVLILFSFSPLYSQHEGANWYFGWWSGLHFSEGEVEVLESGALQTTEGCSSISDPEGNLLFYTDGITVYNRNHLIMTNGDGLLGDPSATQSGVIVPIPNQPELFYIFTVGNIDPGDPMNGFCYSKVDMLAIGGLGMVINNKKNIELIHNSTERVTAVKHANDYAIWVVAHEWESSKFYSYLITDQGLDAINPVISDIGVYMGGYHENGKGYLKASFEGTRLAIAIQGMGLVQIFDFDNSTGNISNPVSLPVEIDPYGIEFSKASKYLYVGERYGNDIHQFDLTAGDEGAIIASEVIIGSSPNSYIGALQMALDGKIYVARKSKKHLGVINDPSLSGTACNYVDEGIYLDCDSCSSQEGLPSFIQSFFNLLWIENEQNCEKDTIFFALNDTTNIESVEWNFGDPESGNANSSNEFFPTHIYNQPGNYQVRVVCTHVTTQLIAKNLDILPLPHVNLIEEAVICRNEVIVLNAGEDFLGYIWNNDSSMNFQQIAVSETGTYWVEVMNSCGWDQDTSFIYVQDLPEVELGEDTAIIYNEQIVLDPGHHQEYFWQDGSTLYEYIVDYPGKYWVEVKDEMGCKSADTINIKAIPFEIHVPTAFSPNNDDLNEVFRVETTYDVEVDFQMQIFNRWGEMVFETNDINDSWNGYYKELQCPMEVYIWLINAKTFEENEFFSGETVQTGTLTLIR